MCAPVQVGKIKLECTSEWVGIITTIRKNGCSLEVYYSHSNACISSSFEDQPEQHSPISISAQNRDCARLFEGARRTLSLCWFGYPQHLPDNSRRSNYELSLASSQKLDPASTVLTATNSPCAGLLLNSKSYGTVTASGPLFLDFGCRYRLLSQGAGSLWRLKLGLLRRKVDWKILRPANLVLRQRLVVESETPQNSPCSDSYQS